MAVKAIQGVCSFDSVYSFVVTFLDAVADLRIGGPRRYPRKALFLEHPMNVAAIVRTIPSPTIVSTFNFAALVCTTVELYSEQEILSAGPLVYASPLRAIRPARDGGDDAQATREGRGGARDRRCFLRGV